MTSLTKYGNMTMMNIMGLFLYKGSKNVLVYLFTVYILCEWIGVFTNSHGGGIWVPQTTKVWTKLVFRANLELMPSFWACKSFPSHVRSKKLQKMPTALLWTARYSSFTEIMNLSRKKIGKSYLECKIRVIRCFLFSQSHVLGQCIRFKGSLIQSYICVEEEGK